MKTQRLYLREMVETDMEALRNILQDDVVMYAYEGAFDEQETRAWFDNQQRRYREDGFGLWAVVLADTDEMIGQCGLTLQKWKEKTLLEVGYLFAQAYWHQGYATEAAIACKEYAFDVLDAPTVYSIIRDTNTASQNVAKRNGMQMVDSSVKYYRGVEMPHDLFEVARDR